MARLWPSRSLVRPWGEAASPSRGRYRPFLEAKKEGRLERLPRIPGATKSVTTRLPISDLETAQEIAERRGLPYQTFIKGLLHQALERENKTR